MLSGLGVIDQSPIVDGCNAVTALQNSVDLAQECERFGYQRYWVAEHHSSNSLAGSAPEILIGRLAAATKTMRIGSGGVMLTHYSAYKVAEQFRTLEALFPNRIDLGVGRAPGSNMTTAAALAKGPGALSSEHYPAQVVELEAYLHDSPDPRGAFRDIRAMPTTPGAPPVWLLASSEGSAAIAAHLGLPLVWAHFITWQSGRSIIDAYRRQFQPSPRWPEPVVMVAAAAVCAETDAEADALATAWLDWQEIVRRGPFPMPQVTATASGEATQSQRRELLRGSPDHVRSELERLADDHGAEEVLVLTNTHDYETRRRSYELLADAFGLTRGSVGPG